jgi:hypothetical protein
MRVGGLALSRLEAVHVAEEAICAEQIVLAHLVGAEL